MCCENRACKKARHMQKKGDYTCLDFLLCVLCDQLYICWCAVYTGLLFRWCGSTAAIARVSEEHLVSHCTMERRQDGLPANRVRNRGQRGRNPPWYCNCPDCRRGSTRPHVFRRGQVNVLRNVRLHVLRQNQRRVAQRVETILVLLVLVLIWLVGAVNSRTSPVAFPRTFCCVTGHPLLERWFSESTGHGFLSELRRMAFCSCFTGTPLP